MPRQPQKLDWTSLDLDLTDSDDETRRPKPGRPRRTRREQEPWRSKRGSATIEAATGDAVEAGAVRGESSFSSDVKACSYATLAVLIIVVALRVVAPAALAHQGAAGPPAAHASAHAQTDVRSEANLPPPLPLQSSPPPPQPPSPPPPPPAPPPVERLSSAMCHAMLHDRTHLFRRMWAAQGWGSMEEEGMPPCWDVARRTVVGVHGEGAEAEQRQPAHDFFRGLQTAQWCDTDWNTNVLVDRDANGHVLFGRPGAPAPAVLGFDGDIGAFCVSRLPAGTDMDKVSQATRCTLGNYNILTLNGYLPPYNLCRNLEWQTCAAMGRLSGQGGPKLVFAVAPGSLDPSGLSDLADGNGRAGLGNCAGWVRGDRDAVGKPRRRGYANDDIFFLEVCLFNQLCSNGEQLFELEAGEVFECAFSPTRLEELEALLREAPAPAPEGAECTDCPSAEGACPHLTPELLCYAERYADLLDGYCHGDAATCDWSALRHHHEHVGASEGRELGCGPPKPGPSPAPSPPPGPSAADALWDRFVGPGLLAHSWNWDWDCPGADPDELWSTHRSFEGADAASLARLDACLVAQSSGKDVPSTLLRYDLPIALYYGGVQAWNRRIGAFHTGLLFNVDTVRRMPGSANDFYSAFAYPNPGTDDDAVRICGSSGDARRSPQAYAASRAALIRGGSWTWEHDPDVQQKVLKPWSCAHSPTDWEAALDEQRAFTEMAAKDPRLPFTPADVRFGEPESAAFDTPEAAPRWQQCMGITALYNQMQVSYTPDDILAVFYVNDTFALTLGAKSPPADTGKGLALVAAEHAWARAVRWSEAMARRFPSAARLPVVQITSALRECSDATRPASRARQPAAARSQHRDEVSPFADAPVSLPPRGPFDDLACDPSMCTDIGSDCCATDDEDVSCAGGLVARRRHSPCESFPGIDGKFECCRA